MLKRTVITMVLLGAGLISYSQDTVYFDKDKKPADRISAFYYEVSHDNDSTGPGNIAESFYMNGSRRSLTCWADKSRDKIENKQEWYPDGQLKMHRKFHGDKVNDTLFTFWENGIPKRVDIHRNGKFIKGTCYNETGEKIPHFGYEVMPEYPGGDNQLFADIFNSITMPEQMKTNGLNEKVIARFSVDTEGNVGEIEIIKGKYAELNKEAVRVLSTLKRWRPGMLDGEAVKIWYTVPITFQVRGSGYQR